MTTMASQITSLTIVYSIVYSQIKENIKAPVTGLCAGNSPGPVNSPHKGPVTRKMFPFDDVIMRGLCKKIGYFYVFIWNVWIFGRGNLCESGLVSNLLFVNSLRWRHNDHAGVSNHQPHGCLLNRLFRRKSRKTSKLRVTGLCVGNSPGTGEFPAQRASYAENVSIRWRHHVSEAASFSEISKR